MKFALIKCTGGIDVIQGPLMHFQGLKKIAIICKVKCFLSLWNTKVNKSLQFNSLRTSAKTSVLNDQIEDNIPKAIPLIMSSSFNFCLLKLIFEWIAEINLWKYISVSSLPLKEDIDLLSSLWIMYFTKVSSR